jgi:hypothetical protein
VDNTIHIAAGRVKGTGITEIDLEERDIGVVSECERKLGAVCEQMEMVIARQQVAGQERAKVAGCASDQYFQKGLCLSV